MADGVFKGSREALSKAQELKSLANNLKDLLDQSSVKMEEIDSIEHGVYQGDKRPAELRAELDDFRSIFNLAYEQIIKFADNIIVTINTVDNE